MRGLFDLAKLWLSDNPLYAPLAAALERLEINAANGDVLNTNEIERMMEEYRAWQPKLKNIAHCVLETEDSGDMREKYLAERTKDKARFPILSYGRLHLEAVYSGGNVPYPYDDLLNFGALSEPAAITAEVLNTERVSDLICFLLCRYLEANLRFDACKFCGKLFGVTGNYKQEYCSRVIPGSEKTCKEMGSVRLYEKRSSASRPSREYKRSYKAHNAAYPLRSDDARNLTNGRQRRGEKRDACVAVSCPLRTLWRGSTATSSDKNNGLIPFYDLRRTGGIIGNTKKKRSQGRRHDPPAPLTGAGRRATTNPWH